MKLSEKDQFIIEQYEQDEEMMILIFAQWCVNHDVDAIAVYEEAYPGQPNNKALVDAMEKTVPKNESEEIQTAVVQQVLQLFGNDDLAFVIQDIADKKNK